MFNKKFLKDSITLFSRYSSLNENDSIYQKDYAEIVVPTFINYCLLTSSGGYKNKNALNYSLGDVSVTFSFNDSITEVYRIIDNQKKYLTYIDSAKYKTLTFEEQYQKYFTLTNGLNFINGINSVFEHSSEIDILSIGVKKLSDLGVDRYTLQSVVKHSDNVVRVQGKVC